MVFPLKTVEPFVFKQPILLSLSGFMAGLAAWTKNEGILFMAVSVPSLMIAGRGSFRRPMAWYLAGLAIPMAVVLYFKIALAPPNDLFAMGDSNTLAKIADFSRYRLILNAFQERIADFGGQPINIFTQLTIYAAVMGLNIPPNVHRGIQAVVIMLFLQMLGYFGIYVLTPHDLEWHLTYSLSRLIFHVFPAGTFLYFCLVVEPEKIFQRVFTPKAVK